MKTHLFLILILISLTYTCTVKRDNSEAFYLEFQGITSGSEPYCFDQIYGINRPNWQELCTKRGQSIGLPLNINQDSSIFVFVKGAKKDTIKTKYLRYIDSNENSYQLILDKYKIYYSTFDSLKCFCSPSDTNYCSNRNGFKAFIFL
ncbi:MAG: hypothetical protein SFY32_12105 [Bacteroidota bacterium]|nr:hypothetical protein [Bacteroidota bacterium]